MKKIQLAAVMAALVVGAAASTSAPALAATRDDPSTPCFFLQDWRGWKSPDPKTIYLGVNNRDIYRVDLSAGSSELQWPDMHLVSINRGSTNICSALDLDLKIADNLGFVEPLIAKRLTKLTPEEAAAVPKKYRPN